MRSRADRTYGLPGRERDSSSLASTIYETDNTERGDSVKEGQTIEEYRAEKAADKAEYEIASLRRILSLGRGRQQVNTPPSHPWGGRLYFDPSGAARLANIAGFIQGLVLAGEGMTPLVALATCNRDNPRDMALQLAVSLDEKLSYLANYGGEKEVLVEEAEGDLPNQYIRVPQYKITLYDDGTFGGFGILWYRPFTTEQVQAKARKNDEEAYQGKNEDGSEMSSEDQHRRWDAALEQAHKDLKLRKELEDFRSWTPSWVKAKRLAYEVKHEAEGHEGYGPYGCKTCDVGSYELTSSSEYIRYGFSHNGGMVLHGMGTPNYSVRLTSDSGPYWSINS